DPALRARDKEGARQDAEILPRFPGQFAAHLSAYERSRVPIEPERFPAFHPGRDKASSLSDKRRLHRGPHIQPLRLRALRESVAERVPGERDPACREPWKAVPTPGAPARPLLDTQIAGSQYPRPAEGMPLRGSDLRRARSASRVRPQFLS